MRDVSTGPRAGMSDNKVFSGWLDGTWKSYGTSNMKNEKIRTLWNDVRMEIKNGIIRGQGTSHFGDNQIPFLMKGEVCQEKVHIQKIHNSFVDKQTSKLTPVPPFSYKLLATIHSGHLYLQTCVCEPCAMNTLVTLVFNKGGVSCF